MNLKSYSKLIFLSATALFLSGCFGKALESLIPQKDYQAGNVAKVKSVAIVAYDTLQFQPTGLGGKISGHVTNLQTIANSQPAENALVLETYGYLQDQFVKKNVKVFDRVTLIKNPTYMKLAADFKPTVQEKMAANPFQKPFIIKGLMRPVNPQYTFKPEQIIQLGKALKVDAIVFTRLAYSSQQNDFIGLGVASIYLRADVRFYMFETTSGQLIWFDHGFLGAASDESIGTVSGMENVETIEKLNRPIAQKSFEDFFKR